MTCGTGEGCSSSGHHAGSDFRRRRPERSGDGRGAKGSVGQVRSGADGISSIHLRPRAGEAKCRPGTMSGCAGWRKQGIRLADSAYLSRLPAFFCRLCCPIRGNLSRQNAATVATLSGACDNSGFHLLRKGLTHQTFREKVVCQQGCRSPLLETQSQRGCAPLDTPVFVVCVYTNLLRLVYFTASEDTKM